MGILYENWNFPDCVHFIGAWDRQAVIETIAVVYENTKRTQEMCSPIGHNNTKHFLCPIRSRHPLEFLEMVRWESVPGGSFALTWKLSSRLFSRPDWLPLGLRGCDLFSHNCITTQIVKLFLLNNVKSNVWFCNLNPPSWTLAIVFWGNVMFGFIPINVIPMLLMSVYSYYSITEIIKFFKHFSTHTILCIRAQFCLQITNHFHSCRTITTVFIQSNI